MNGDNRTETEQIISFSYIVYMSYKVFFIKIVGLDKVLAVLPLSGSTFLAHYSGPYVVKKAS